MTIFGALLKVLPLVLYIIGSLFFLTGSVISLVQLVKK